MKARSKGVKSILPLAFFVKERFISVKSQGMIQLHLAVFLFGLSGLFGKLLSIPATAIVLGRTSVAALALAGLLIARRSPVRLTCRLGLRLFPSGALLALHWFTFFYSIQISSVSTGLLSFATFPVFVAFLDPLFSKRNIQRLDLLFAVIVFIGLIVIIPSFELSDRFFQGTLWGLASAVTFALLTLFNRRFVTETDAMIVGLFQNFWAAVCLCIYWSQLGSINSTEFLLIVVLGVFCTALAHTLFIAALKTVRPQLASVTAGLEPLYGILLAFIFLGESPGMNELIGGLLIIAVVVASSRRDRAAAEESLHS
jgi:drug/metabolite transporter (DMT)-like permease